MNEKRAVFVITGANTGIGAACARELARPGVEIVLACRSEEKARPVLDEVRARGATATFLPLVLGSLGASRASANELAARVPAIDLLVNNAGVAGGRGATDDGYELAFGVNHLGHYAFTLPLLPALEAARGRIVNVSSGNHYFPKRLDLAAVRGPTTSRTGLPEYGVSKLANVLFTAELRRRYPRVESVAVNPGRIASDIWRSVPSPLRRVLPWLLRMGTVETGGHTLVHAARVALDDELLYLHRLAPKRPSPLATSPALAAELWAFSERAVADALVA